jgi:hypothetical protein
MHEGRSGAVRMSKLRQSNALIFAAAALTLAASFFVTFVLLMERDERPGFTSARNTEDVPDVTSSHPAPEPLSLDQELQRDLREAGSEEAKIEVLNRFSQDPQARSSSSALRASMLVEKSAQVRLKAFQTARDLALKEDRGALTSILKEGIGNPYSEVRRESLRACRDNPRYELLQDLLEVAERGGQDRSIAIQALAFMDDPEAQRKVLETARSEQVPKADRIQAIALLAKSNLSESVSYLQELATGDNEELQPYAMEALSAWQDRKARD